MDTDHAATRLAAPAPSLTRRDAGDSPRALLLCLHGGTQVSTDPVGDRSLSWLRMAALQRSLDPPLRRSGVASWLVKYAVRGWNGTGAPVADARWALDQVRSTYGDIPVVLLGHSMGGRTAVHVADDPSVLGAVVLAPWLPPADPVSALAGKHLRAAHGRADRITSYAATEAYVARAASVAASAELSDMGPLGHYMLRGHRRWRDHAATEIRALLDTV